MSTHISLDVRLPIGAMFGLDGLILMGHGLLKTPPAAAATAGVGNVNLWWGAVLVVFGGGMLAWALFGKKKTAAATAKG